MISRNGVSYGTANTGKPSCPRDLDERRRHALEAEADAEAERARAALLELRHERALRVRVPAQPHAGREHDPVRAEPARRRVDLDGMRAANLARLGLRPAAEQLEPERLLGEQVGETEHGRPQSTDRLGIGPNRAHAFRHRDGCRAHAADGH